MPAARSVFSRSSVAGRALGCGTITILLDAFGAAEVLVEGNGRDFGLEETAGAVAASMIGVAASPLPLFESVRKTAASAVAGAPKPSASTIAGASNHLVARLNGMRRADERTGDPRRRDPARLLIRPIGV